MVSSNFCRIAIQLVLPILALGVLRDLSMRPPAETRVATPGSCSYAADYAMVLQRHCSTPIQSLSITTHYWAGRDTYRAPRQTIPSKIRTPHSYPLHPHRRRLLLRTGWI